MSALRQESGPPKLRGSLILPIGASHPAPPAAQGAPDTGFIGDDNGAASRYSFPDSNVRPRKRLDITRIYLPVAVVLTGSLATPANATLRIAFVIGQETRWSSSAEIPLYPVAGSNAGAGNSVLVEDFINPVAIFPEDVLNVTYSVTGDAALNDVWVAIAATTSPVTGEFVSSPGTVFWTAD